jgi:3-oxoacyl-[acyl-carrier protein] reductase
VPERLLDTLAIRRWDGASEVSELICFLASGASHYITGTLAVSGVKLATQLPQRAHEIAGPR